MVYPEVVAIARRLGPDPAALVAFVHDSVRYEPYSGALRGARGALLARAGNAVDQALLLRGLLEIAFPEAESRFAFAHLPFTGAEQLLNDATGLVADTPRTPSNRPAADPEASDTELGRMWQRFEADRKFAADAAQADARVLTTLLNESGVVLGSSLPSHETRRETARDHVWLQLRQNGEWIDLDPTLRNPAAGQRRADPDRTATDLPNELYHQVEIHAKVEEQSNSTLATRYLLRTTWRSADLVGSTITYTHPEGVGIESLFPQSGQPPPGTVRYTPLLIVDDEYGLGEPFLLPAPPAPATSLGDGFGGLGSRLGGMLGGGSRTAARDSAPAVSASPVPEVTALFLELRILAPDGTQQTFERAIFDRIGFAARAPNAVATMPRAPVPSAFGLHLPLLGLWSIATWTGERRLAPLTPDLGFEEEQETSFRAMLEQLGAFHRAYYSLQPDLLRLVANEQLGASAHAINVSVLGSIVPQGSNSSDPVLVLDTVYGPVDVTRKARPDGAIAPNLLWATTRLHAERLLFRALDADGAPGERAPGERPDVNSVFDAAIGSGARLVLLRPTDASRVAALPFSAEAQARLRARLGEGLFVVVPERQASASDPVGWWLMEPKTGTVLDEMEDGRHSAGRQAGTENQGVTQGTTQKTAAVRTGFVQRIKRAVHRGACFIVAVVAAGTAAAAAPGDVLEPIADAGEAIAAACSRARGETGPRPRGNRGGQGPPSGSFTSGPASPSPGAISGSGWDAKTLQGRWPPLIKREGSD